MSFLVKICGIRTAEDWQVCADAGADMVGLMFYPPSKRAISPSQARELAAAAGWGTSKATSSGILARGAEGGEPLRVGVFVDPTGTEVEEAVDAAQLGAVQLHGAAPLPGAQKAIELGLPILMALPVASSLDHRQFEVATGFTPSLWLADTQRAGQHGGTGELFAHELLVPFLGSHRILLAGGLNPGNVAAAVASLPGLAGCDVSSGVEASPGVKDHRKIREFIAEARRGAALAVAQES